MSKLSPFLQEVVNDLESNGADAEETSVVVNDIEANIELQKKQCNDTEGMIWNPEANNGQGSCDMKVDTSLDETNIEVEVDEDIDVEDVVVENDGDVSDISNFEELVTVAVVKGGYEDLEVFDPETEKGERFWDNLQEVYDRLKEQYPGYTPTVIDIQNFVAMDESVLNIAFEGSPDLEIIADIYFEDIDDVIGTDGYKNNYQRNAGDPEFDFNKWYYEYDACTLGGIRDCKKYFKQYTNYKKNGKLDISVVSEEQMELARKFYVRRAKTSVMKELLPEQQEFMKALAGEDSELSLNVFPDIEVIGDLDQMYFKYKTILMEGGYLDVENLKGFNLAQPFTEFGVSENKVERMIINTFENEGLEFGNGDKQYKIYSKFDGDDVLTIVGPTTREGGRLTLKLDLDAILSDSDVKTRQNWERTVEKILIFFNPLLKDAAGTADIIYMSGGKYHGLTLNEVKVKRKEDNFIANKVINSQIPTTSDIIKDSYNSNGDKVFTYEAGVQTGGNSFGDTYSTPVFYRINVLTGERTIIKDVDLSSDLYARYWLKKKEELTSNPKHDFLFPGDLGDMSLNSYFKSNRIFIERINPSDGAFVPYTSFSIAETLGEKYADFEFKSNGAGKVIITDPISGKSKEISFVQETLWGRGDHMVYNVNSFESFKFDLVSFIEENSVNHTEDEVVVKKELRQRVYNQFYGTDGIATTLSDEQAIELEVFENNPPYSSYDVEYRAKEFQRLLEESISISIEKGIESNVGEKYFYSESDYEYSNEVNLAIKMLETNLGKLNTDEPELLKQMIAEVASDLIIKSKRQELYEKNISDFVQDASYEDMIEVFGFALSVEEKEGLDEYSLAYWLDPSGVLEKHPNLSVSQKRMFRLVNLASTENKTELENRVNSYSSQITILQGGLQNGEEMETFSSFMDVLSGDEGFMSKGSFTQEDIDEGRVIAVRTPSGGVMHVPIKTYNKFSIATIGIKARLKSIADLQEAQAIYLEQINDQELYQELVAKSYIWGDYMGTQLIGGVAQGYITIMGASGNKTWLDMYSDLKAWKGSVSKEASMFDIDDLGIEILNPLNWPGFLMEFTAEQSQSFSQFGFGMMLGSAMGSPQLGLLIASGVTGKSSFSGNLMDHKLQYASKNGNLEGFDEDNALFYESLAIGGVNAVSAYVSAKFFNQTFNFFKSIVPSGAQKISFYETFQSYANLQLKYGTLDATVEAVTEISENVIKGEDIQWDLAGKVFIESGLFNLLLPTTGLGMSAVLQFCDGYDALGGVRENLRTIGELRNKLELKLKTGNFNRKTQAWKLEIEGIQMEIDVLSKKNGEAMKKTYEKMGKLDKGMFIFLHSLDLQQRQIEIKIEDIKADDSKSLKEKAVEIEKLENQYADNKKEIKGFFNDNSIRNKWSVLVKNGETNQDNKATADRIRKVAIEKLKADGNNDPDQVDIDGVASIIYNTEVLTEDHKRSQIVLEKLNPELAKRTKLVQTVDEGVEMVSEIYDAEINRLGELDPESIITVGGVQVKVSKVIDAVKNSKTKTIASIKNGGHGANINFTEQGGKKYNLTVAESAAADDRTENKTHEIGHDAFVEMLGGDQKSYQALSDIVSSYLQKNHKNLWKLVNSTVERDENGDMKNDELVMRFLELVASDQIKFDGGKKTDSMFSTLFGFFASEAIETQTGLEFSFDIKGSDGAIHFLKTLALKIKSGDITTDDIKNIKDSNLIKNLETEIEGNIEKIDFSKMSSNVQAGVVNDLYEGPFPDIFDQEGKTSAQTPMWVFDILEQYGGMVRVAADKYANIPGIDYDVLDGFRMDILYSKRGLLGLINDYNPESADYVFVTKDGTQKTVSVTYNRKGEVTVDGDKVKDLDGFTREQMIQYVTSNYGNIVEINPVPLSGYINLYLGRRVIDVAKENASVRDAIAGITVEQGDSDVVTSVADEDSNTDHLYDENNNNIEEKTGEVRKIFNIEKDGTLYNKVIETVKAALPEITTDEALSNPKNQKKYRQALEKIFVAELTGDLKEIFDSKEKFVDFLTKHQDAITQLVAIKYKNRFGELTYNLEIDGKNQRKDTEQMQSPDNLDSGDSGAGNKIWNIKDLSVDEFVKIFTEGRKGDTRKASLLKALANELGLDAVFTALPPSLESKTGKLAEALKRNPYTKFSDANGGTYGFDYAIIKDGKNKGTINTNLVEQDIYRLVRMIEKDDFLKYLDLETMTIAGHPEFDKSIVAFVYTYAHDPSKNASSQRFISAVKKNPNFINADGTVNAQLQDFIDQGTFSENIDAQKKQVSEVTNVATKYINGELWVFLQGNGFGFYKKALNSARTQRNPGGARKDGKSMPVDNKSHSGTFPIKVANWKFDYKAVVEKNGKTYTGAFVGMVDGKEVISLDPVKDHEAKIISAPYYNAKQNISDNLNMEFESDIIIEFDDIRIMNGTKPGGLMDRLDKIMYGSVEEYGEYGSPERKERQLEELAKMMPEINRANIANVDANVSLNIGWFDAIENGEATVTGLLRFLQLQTSDTEGPRGLSTIIGLSLPNEPKTEKNQGEHMIATAETSGKIADLAGRAFLLDENGRVIGYKPGFDRDVIKAELYKIMRNNAQVLVPHSFSKTMDKGPGKSTSDAGFNRDNFLDNDQSSTLIGIDGLPFVETKLQIAILDNVKQETITIETENKKELQFNDYMDAIYVNNSTNVESKSMVADFDETMWSGGDNVIVATNPVTGQQIDIDAKDFHKLVAQYEKDGWIFNFDDFVNVKGGERGPYFDRAIRFIKEEGLDGFSILTARQPESAVAIAHVLHAELLKDGVTKQDGSEYTVDEILEKITGLGVKDPITGETIRVTGKMKADWILDNIVSNGYTKVEFADDGLEQVEEVKTMFADLPDGTIEGTSLLVTEEFKDNHAKFSNKTNSETFNIFIEETSGVPKNNIFSNVRARQQGSKIGRINNLVPYSAEDFKGLLYQFLGEGKMGEYQLAWFTEKLIKPYSRGESNLKKQTIKISAQFEKLIKGIPNINKKLKSTIIRPNGQSTYFNNDMAVRVYLWDKNGIDIPGLSERDRKLLVESVTQDPELRTLADQVGAISNLPDGYVKPGKGWEAGSISDDMQRLVITEMREASLSEFEKNSNEIFSEENLNKIEAIHGTKYRVALENMLARMKTGRSDAGFNSEKDPVTKRWDEWVNNSVGAIMFLNGRSAVLQTLSTFNYVKINGPNNAVNAAKAFANQPQFWTDFTELWNSEYLTERRDGEKRGINESELAEAVKNGGARGAIAYLLKLGFTPTKLADSFAIASGGATYVRNYTNAIADMLLDFQSSDVDIKALFEAQDIFTKDELNAYLGDRDINDLTEEEVQDLAKNIALEKWEMETETGQQSSRQDMLSQEQTGGLGRLILAFKNTPMQYTRKITRALQDLKNNRGNPAEHIANIAYYGGVQALMFNGLQQALFARLDDDDDDWDDATDRVIQGMVDGYIQGMGLNGAIVVTVKNGVLEFIEQDRKGWNADHTYTILEFANISPTIGSKLRKIYSAIKGRQLNEDAIAEMDLWDPQNPAWMAVANLIEAFTNIPTADVVGKINNLIAASSDEAEFWQSLSLLLGWNTWDVNVETKSKKIKKELKIIKKEEKKETKKEENQNEVNVDVIEEIEKEEEGEGVDVNQCGSATSSGGRCKNQVDKAGDKCVHHRSKDIKVQKCSYVRPKGSPNAGKQCKNDAITDAGRCNVPQHQ